MNNHVQNGIYDIGIDIGNTSVGYAVTDENGRLLHFKKQNMWGVRLFESASDSRDTRLARNARRRFSRRRQRIELLRRFFIAGGFLGEDFFVKLDKSGTADKGDPLFLDSDYGKSGLCRNYKTVYHLRKHLCICEEKADIRLIYLALHHIVKYRGNFNCEDIGDDFKISACRDESVAAFLMALDERYPTAEHIYLFDKTNDILYSDNSRPEKQKALAKLLNESCACGNDAEQLAKAIFGFSAKFGDIFGGEKASFSFSEAEKTAEYREALNETDGIFFDCVLRLYFTDVLNTVLGKENISTISDAFIARYNEHAVQLKDLKKLYKKYTSEEAYSAMFNFGVSQRSYAEYIQNEKNCPYTEVYKQIRKDLNDTGAQTDALYEKCLADMKNEAFLRKLKGAYNKAIPYQLHLAEMEMIIDNQSKYYPFLAESKKELMSLVSFRLPYYVGPLNSSRDENGSPKFGWAVRKNPALKVYPWNFDEVIDIEKSSEAFISRLSGSCSYLAGEKTLPRYSPLYSEFCLRNELINLKVNGKHLSAENFETLYNEFTVDGGRFYGKSNVSEKQLIKYFSEVFGKSDVCVSGIRTNGTLASDMRVLRDMRSVQSLKNADTDVFERIAYLVTVYKEKKLLKCALKNEFPFIPKSDIEQIASLKYSGWGKLSAALLDGIKIEHDGESLTVMEIMRKRRCPFVQITTDSSFGFREAVEQFNRSEENASIDDMIDSIAGSPAIKKGIRECIKVTDEIVKLMGHPPRNIYMEFATEDRDSYNSASRKDLLLSKYESVKDVPEYNETYKLICSLDEKALADNRIFHYCLQNGRCLYSGKKLDFNHLTEECVLDTIIPPCYFRDNSAENTALVLKNAVSRNDVLLLDGEIRKRSAQFWRELKELYLISNKKYYNLMRENFEENEIKSYISKQLVEVRQITKHTAEILKEQYCRNGESTKIIQIKSTLTNELRAYLKLPKNRCVNDYHHAHDAYICVMLGIFTQKCYPNVFGQFDCSDIRHYIMLNKRKAAENTYGYIVGRFNDTFVCEESGEIIWDGNAEAEKLAHCLEYKDCYISKKPEEQTGAFYKQNLRPAGSSEKLIPKKKGLSPALFGGYAQPAEAYSVIIEYDAKKGRGKKLVGIPIYIEKLRATVPDAVNDYLAANGYRNAVILKDRILKYQKILTNGSEYFLSSATEVHNAKQLTLPKEMNALVYKMNYRNYLLEEEAVPEQKLIELYDLLCLKISIQYPGYSNVQARLVKKRSSFAELEKKQKATVLNELFHLLHADARTADLQILGLSQREGRKNKLNIDVDSTVFVNSSVTGMFENKTRGKDIKKKEQ